MPRQEWGGIEPMGEVFLLTFLFIGLVREADYSAMCQLPVCRPLASGGYEPRAYLWNCQRDPL